MDRRLVHPFRLRVLNLDGGGSTLGDGLVYEVKIVYMSVRSRKDSGLLKFKGLRQPVLHH